MTCKMQSHVAALEAFLSMKIELPLLGRAPCPAAASLQQRGAARQLFASRIFHYRRLSFGSRNFTVKQLFSPAAANCTFSEAKQPRNMKDLPIIKPSSPAIHDLESTSSEASKTMVAFQIDSDLRNLVLQGATLAGIFVLQQFSQAWGGEIAEVQQSAGILGNIGEIKNGFTLAFLLIFFSELGDKTFFIAALLATRKPNVAVFMGTFGALVAMTLISVTLGRAFHYIDGVLPFSLGNTELPLDDLAAVALLLYFGVSTLVDAASMEGSKAQEEQQEAELAIAGVNGGSSATVNVVVSTFVLVFVAEWGDKSFFSTIALAAASSPVGVVAGAIAGHGAATLLAVLGGSILGNYISEKVIAYIGGILFLVFAAETLFEILSGVK